ncbi:unnamed protein product [Ceutorhynchus assimilis]|uniref:Glycoprotein-N-acetylgalactosamine 3-beta-galactosyltransferase 1 n=1 Tax=Ceutorhynchus assimilis TaxID=467358 RepID=A0A9N9MTV4_9CUCU|nr:unnamed protein product [Ceutorhynchus assimilis]
MERMRVPMINFLARPAIPIFLAGILVGLTIGVSILLMQTDQYNFYYYDNSKNPIPYFDFVGDHSNNDTHHRMLDTSMADEMFQKVRILCWIMTGPANHFKKAIHVKATWGKRCNKLIFMSSEADPLLPSVALPVREDRPHLWGKTKEAMKYVYNRYYDQYDWFFKADDDTYTVMENMRYMLYYANSSDPIYYGCRMKSPPNNMDFMSGGAGYILSKEALRRFVEDALPNRHICRSKDTGDEDVEISKCLQAVGVELGDSLDNENRNRFTPVFVNDMLIPGILNDVKWFTDMMYHPYNMGLTCCSDNLISTHYVTPHQMYLLEYLIYHVTPFGRAYNPKLEKNKEIMKKEVNTNNFSMLEVKQVQTTENDAHIADFINKTESQEREIADLKTTKLENQMQNLIINFKNQHLKLNEAISTSEVEQKYIEDLTKVNSELKFKINNNQNTNQTSNNIKKNAKRPKLGPNSSSSASEVEVHESPQPQNEVLEENGNANFPELLNNTNNKPLNMPHSNLSIKLKQKQQQAHTSHHNKVSSQNRIEFLQLLSENQKTGFKSTTCPKKTT